MVVVVVMAGEGGLCGSVNANKKVVVITVVGLVVGWGGRSDRGTGSSRGSGRHWEILT